MLVVDAGDLSGTWPPPGGSAAEAARQKAGAQHAAFAAAGVDAMLPGPGDLGLGVAWLEGQAAAHSLPYVAANLQCDGRSPFPPHRDVATAAGPVRIVGVLGTGRTLPAGCAAGDPVAAVAAAAAQSPPARQVLVLAHMDDAELRGVAAAAPGALVLQGGEGRATDKPGALPGAGAVVSAGERGKKLGRIDLQFVPGGGGFAVGEGTSAVAARRDRTADRLRLARSQAEAATDGPARDRAARRVAYLEGELARVEADLAAVTAGQSGGLRHGIALSLHALDDAIPDDPSARALVDAALAAAAAAVAAAPAPPADAGPFVGSEACAGCHPGPTAQWSRTAHAHAWDTLATRHATGDPACVSCHATGLFHPDGPKGPAGAALRPNVGCESCHGPGAAHVAQPQSPMVRTPPLDTCTACHDGDRDEGRFDPPQYLPRVQHADTR